MMSKFRAIFATTGLSLALASSVLAAPAYAGGPGTVYVYGATLNECNSNLSSQVTNYRHYGYSVTGINGCRPNGGQYLGDFVANRY